MKGISYLQEPLMLLWIKQRPIYFQLKRSLTGNEFSYIKNTFFRKILVINTSFVPKYVNLQSLSLKFGQNVKMFQAKY